MSVYKVALDTALQNEDNTNIALSGSYGSGKSSIIESYKKDSPDENKFLHISLGQFDTDMTDKSKCGNDSILKEKTIEGKIINQLLHQIDTSKIPQTIFKVKKSTKDNPWCVSICIVVFLFLLAYVINFSQWADFLHKNSSQLSLLAFTSNGVSLVIALGVIFILLALFLNKMVNLQFNKGIIKKLSVKGNEIEIMAEKSESYFDKYLNDVIYLFENSGVNIIVFEDIDRFNSGKIFANLREINTLVNNRKKGRKKDEKLVFLYLLRDDIFTSKDRTKFFDIIIPVVPVVDGSNSYEKFIEIFKKGNILDKFELNFLQKLSLYVDDMRLLKNIYNEFVIYQRSIDKFGLDCNKLLALITYKNIFPRDFADLQLARGFVFSIFSQKERLVNKKTNALKSDLKNIQREKDEMEKEILESIDELDILALGNPSNYTINGVKIDDYDSLASFIQDFKNPTNNVHEKTKFGLKLVDGDLRTSILNRPTFKARKNIIQKKDSNKMSELESEMDAISKDLDNISSYRLEQLITNEDFSEVVTPKEYKDIKESNYYLLLVFLIKNGYINETYTEYMTYFYDNSITLEDKLFLRSITDERPLDWFYSLNRILPVLDRMEEYDFSKKEALNADLLNFMLTDYSKYEPNLRRMILSLKDEHNTEFFRRVFKKNQKDEKIKENKIFLEIMLSEWNGFLETLLYSNNEINDLILQMALDNFEESIILSQNNTYDELSSYLNTSTSLLPKIQSHSKQTIANLIALKVKFATVEFELTESKLAKSIYEEALYELNLGNIKSILSCFYNGYSAEEFKHENYTLIKNKQTSFLLDYINHHINTYVVEYIKISEDSIRDSEDNVIELLNNGEIEDKVKSDYICGLETKISNLTSILDKNLWEQLIEKDVVISSGDNVVEYYHFNDNKWSGGLVEFVNRSINNIQINLTAVNEKFKKIGLFTNTIKMFDLNDDKYITLLDSMKRSYTEDLIGVDNFQLNDVPQEKIVRLIDKQIINMSEGCLNDIREYYPNEINRFIKQNLNSYLELSQNQEIYNEDEILSLLDAASDLELSQQKDIVNAIRHPVSINEKNYSSDLIEFILEEKFSTSDLSFIISKYKDYSENIQNIIASRCIEHLDEVLMGEINIPKELLVFIINSNQFSVGKRQRLFSQCIESFSKEEIGIYIPILELSNSFTEILKGEVVHSRSFKDNIINQQILNHFRLNNWIINYTEKNNSFVAKVKNK